MLGGTSPRKPMNAAFVSRLRLPAAVTAWLTASALAAGLYRHGRALTFDAYYYCELAKQYAHSWPTAFGNHWPCGYPLLGGLLGRLGLPAYDALCALSLLALLGMVLLGSRLAADLPSRALVVTALAATPVIGVQLFGNLSELPFASALLGLACALAAWQRRGAWAGAAGCALLALSLRYAGVIAFALLWIWLAAHARAMRRAGTLVAGLSAVIGSSLAAAALLLWNLRVTGYLSGASRQAVAGLGLVAWPHHVGDLGWSLPSALMLGSLRVASGGEALTAQTIGWALCLGAVAVCLWGCLRPCRPWVRAVSSLALAYGGGMTVLRSIGTFDALYDGRDFLPAVFPLGLVAAAQCSPRWPRAVAAVGVIWLAAGVISSVRGLSREIAGDIRAAVPVLQARLGPGDGIQINDHAFSLAAYFRQPTYRTDPQTWRADGAQRFLVLAAAPIDRRGTPGTLSPAWQAFVARNRAQGTLRPLLETPALLVFERAVEGISH